VQRSGIDLAQGYWYGKPMAIDQLRAFASAKMPISALHNLTGTEHGVQDECIMDAQPQPQPQPQPQQRQQR
jgi:hypothetical protein